MSRREGRVQLGSSSDDTEESPAGPSSKILISRGARWFRVIEGKILMKISELDGKCSTSGLQLRGVELGSVIYSSLAIERGDDCFVRRRNPRGDTTVDGKNTPSLRNTDSSANTLRLFCNFFASIPR